MNFIRNLNTYFLRKVRVFQKKEIVKKEQKLLGYKDFVIISDNCWGGAVYQWYNKPYNSPFVGLGVYGECYIKLLSNFDYYMNLALKFKPQEESIHPYKFKNSFYPMGVLEDVEIHFVHYKTIEEAKEKWTKRTNRMLKIKDKNNYFFKICDDWKANDEQINEFHNLPFKNKVSFVPDNKKTIDSPFQIAIYERHKKNKISVPNGLGLFKITFLYFDLTKWLITSKIYRTINKK
jgi:uncharacterized protein (DUF1919 family)